MQYTLVAEVRFPLSAASELLEVELDRTARMLEALITMAILQLSRGGESDFTDEQQIIVNRFDLFRN